MDIISSVTLVQSQCINRIIPATIVVVLVNKKVFHGFGSVKTGILIGPMNAAIFILCARRGEQRAAKRVISDQPSTHNQVHLARCNHLLSNDIFFALMAMDHRTILESSTASKSNLSDDDAVEDSFFLDYHVAVVLFYWISFLVAVAPSLVFVCSVRGNRKLEVFLIFIFAPAHLFVAMTFWGPTDIYFWLVVMFGFSFLVALGVQLLQAEGDHTPLERRGDNEEYVSWPGYLSTLTLHVLLLPGFLLLADYASDMNALPPFDYHGPMTVRSCRPTFLQRKQCASNPFASGGCDLYAGELLIEWPTAVAASAAQCKDDYLSMRDYSCGNDVCCYSLNAGSKENLCPNTGDEQKNVTAAFRTGQCMESKYDIASCNSNATSILNNDDGDLQAIVYANSQECYVWAESLVNLNHHLRQKRIGMWLSTVGSSILFGLFGWKLFSSVIAKNCLYSRIAPKCEEEAEEGKTATSTEESSFETQDILHEESVESGSRELEMPRLTIHESYFTDSCIS